MTRRRRWRRETAGDNKYRGHWLAKKWWHYYRFYLILCVLWRLLEGCKPKIMGQTAKKLLLLLLSSLHNPYKAYLITTRRWRLWFLLFDSTAAYYFRDVTTRSIINRRVLLSFPHEWIIESNKSLLITNQPIAKTLTLRHHVFILLYFFAVSLL